MNYQAYFGIFIVVLVGAFVSVQYFGAPGETLPFSVSVLVLAIGAHMVVKSIRKRNNDN